jgi:GT2 family glycosyltransferase
LRDRRATARRRALAARLLSAGLIDGAFLSAQLNVAFVSDAQAAAAWALTEPRLQYAPHPLIEPSWIDVAALSGAHGGHCTSVGPQLALEGTRAWIDEAAAVISRLEPGDLLPSVFGIEPVSVARAVSIAHETAGEFARQNLRSLRRHAAQFTPPAEVTVALAETVPGKSVLVSIVMPVRDRAAVVGTAINSVRAQIHEHWELLIVDDGSTDGTASVVIDYAARDARIRLIRQDPIGVSAARNRGIAEARGDLVAFLDSDNTWTPQHLAAAVHAIGDGTQRAVHTVVRIRRSDGEVEFTAEQVDRDTLLQGRNAVDLNSLVVGRAALTQVGGFDESIRRWVDYDLVLRLARRFDLQLVPIVGVDYDHRRDAPDRITTRESPRWRRVVLEHALIDWNHLEESLPKRVDALSIVIRSRAQWPLTLATVQHLRSLTAVVDVIVVDAASPRAETGILTLATAADPAITVMRTAWDGGWSLSVQLALATARGRTVLAVEPGACPSATMLARAVDAARAEGGMRRDAHATDGILLAADVDALIAARGFDLVDDPLVSLE